MRTEKKDYLLNQNQEEAKEWLKFLCEHTDKEELKTLEDEIANRFVFKVARLYQRFGTKY